MERLQLLTQTMLVDRLAEYTAKYIRIRVEGGSKEDFNNCLQTIELLTKEIASRKKQKRDNMEVIDNSQFVFF